MSAVIDAKEFVEVVDGDGNPVPGFEHSVPKAWVGTQLLPAGAKAKGRSKSSKSSGDGDKGQQSQQPDVFDPSKHNQDEVLAYLADAEVDEVERVKAAEAEGKNRDKIAAFEPADSSGEDNKTEPEGS